MHYFTAEFYNPIERQGLQLSQWRRGKIVPMIASALNLVGHVIGTEKEAQQALARLTSRLAIHRYEHQQVLCHQYIYMKSWV